MVCIGGQSDGRRIACHGPTMQQPRLEKLKGPDLDLSATSSGPIPSRDTYHRESIGFASGVRVYFWRSADLPVEVAVQDVFNAYGQK
jgi:hypothetical protein